MKKRPSVKQQSEGRIGAAYKEAILVLARAGYVRPGLCGDEVSYVLKHDRQGNLTGVDVHINDDALGEVFDCLTTEVE